MTVAVAHQASSATKHVALQEAAREASARGGGLAVVHIVDALDLDVVDAYRNSLSDEIEASIKEVGASGVEWTLHLSVGDQDVAHRVLDLTKSVEAAILVIGARRRSPVGKFLMGSTTQTLILESDVPVLVVKSST